MRIVNFLFAVILLFFTASCIREEVIDEDYFDQPIQPVILCALAPGDSIQLMLIKSNPLNDESVTYRERGIYNADVKIANELGDTILLKVEDSLPLYKGSQETFSIMSGKQYWLNITFEDNTKLYATTKVPENGIKWDEFLVYNERDEWREFIESSKQGDKVYKNHIFYKSIQATWVDDENRTKVVSIREIDRQPKGIVYPNYEDYLDDNIEVTSCCKILDKKDLIVYYENNYRNSISKYTHIFHLITLNDDLKNYYRMYDLLFNNDEDLETGQFLNLYRGVVPEYDNIDGGLGVFGAYIISDKHIVQ